MTRDSTPFSPTLAREKGGQNLGTRTRKRIPAPAFPNTDALLQEALEERPKDAVDILLVNPPAPDGGIWIRSQHRVGRRSREGMIWPQVELAQMAALFPDYRVEVVDAIPSHMTWEAFEALLDEKRPRYYVTQVTAPTLENDMFGVFLAKARGAVTMAFGTHVTPMPRTTMEAYPALDGSCWASRSSRCARSWTVLSLPRRVVGRGCQLAACPGRR